MIQKKPKPYLSTAFFFSLKLKFFKKASHEYNGGNSIRMFSDSFALSSSKYFERAELFRAQRCIVVFFPLKQKNRSLSSAHINAKGDWRRLLNLLSHKAGVSSKFGKSVLLNWLLLSCNLSQYSNSTCMVLILFSPLTSISMLLLIRTNQI